MPKFEQRITVDVYISMNRNELRKWLLDNAFKSNGNSLNLHALLDVEILDAVHKYTDFLEGGSLVRRIYAVLECRTEPYRCVECDKIFTYNDKRPTLFCSKECASKSNIVKRKSTNWSRKIPDSSHLLSLREWLLTYAFTNSGNAISSRTFIEDEEQSVLRLRELYTETSFFPDHTPISTRVYAYLNRQDGLIRCVVCNQEIKPNNRGQQSVFCSGGCAAKFKPLRDRVKQTCQTKYGGNAPASSQTILEKIRKTCLERYGADNYGSTDECVEKMKRTNQKLYGVDWSFQRLDVKEKCQKLSNDQYTYLNDPHNMRDRLESIGAYAMAEEIQVHITTIYKYLSKHGIMTKDNKPVSSVENNLINWIEEFYTGDIVCNSRTIIPPYELDIYLPDENIAIEYNGVYWHLEQQGKTRNYHLNKTLQCRSKNIQLYHIFSSDNLDIWKSVLLNRLGKSKTIYARKTGVVELDSKEVKEFCDLHHLQGGVYGSLNYGLLYNSSIVAVMNFCKSRFNRADYELLRFCTSPGYRVVGGASKLLAYFRLSNTGSIVSYANLRWSNGKLYEALGFKLLHRSTPNYFYTKDCYTLYSRNRFQKHMLKDKLESFDPDLTEYENMLNNGYDRIWDCGNLVYLGE
jgi:hypothetical protein